MEAVIGYLKEKLPAPIADQIDNLLAGGGVTEQAEGLLGDILGKLGE